MSNFAQFLPQGSIPAAPPPPPSPQPRGRKPAPPPGPPADAESTPERQMSRRLGDYGADTLRDYIQVKYAEQEKKWGRHIENIVTAYSMALESKNNTAQVAEKQLEEERRAQMEWQLFLFSLVLGGTLRWAGTYVQYRFVPRHQTPRIQRSFIHLNDKDGIPVPTPITEITVSKDIAAFVGGLTQDVGNRVGMYLAQDHGRSTPSPKGLEGLDDRQPVSVTRVLEQELKSALEAGVKAVSDQMKDAIVWMEQSPEFGNAWRTFAGGNEARARDLIRMRLQQLRDEWAKKWPYFGQDPKPFDRNFLSRAFERGIWAAAIPQLFASRGVEQLARNNENLKQNLPPEYAEIDANTGLRKLKLGAAIIDRLQYLNVIAGDTVGEQYEQMRQIGQGAPAPSVSIDGDTTTLKEAYALLKWAFDFSRKQATSVVARAAEGIPRPLDPIPVFAGR